VITTGAPGLAKLLDRLRIEMMGGIVGDEDQVGGLGAGQIAHRPGIHLDDLPGVLDLDAGVEERRDFDVAAGRGHPVGSPAAAVSAVNSRKAAAANFCMRIFPAMIARCYPMC
jgi:hypothetical protein